MVLFGFPSDTENLTPGLGSGFGGREGNGGQSHWVGNPVWCVLLDSLLTSDSGHKQSRNGRDGGKKSYILECYL
jgi:hypothetical protein